MSDTYKNEKSFKSSTMIKMLFDRCTCVKYVQFDRILNKLTLLSVRVTKSVILSQCVRLYAILNFPRKQNASIISNKVLNYLKSYIILC